MKHTLIIVATALALITSTLPLSAYSKTSSPAPKQQDKQKQSNTMKLKAKKPEYYRGHSYGWQNYPGKTIDAGANTGMLPTNSSSPLMGNDISF